MFLESPSQLCYFTAHKEIAVWNDVFLFLVSVVCFDFVCLFTGVSVLYPSFPLTLCWLIVWFHFVQFVGLIGAFC